MLRIGIVGAQSVGKTTLAESLSSTLGYVLIEEQIRESVKEFVPLGYSTPDQIANTKWYPHLMFDILLKQVQKEICAKNGFVSDRTTLDYYAYYELMSHDSYEVRKIIKDLFLPRFQNSYDIIFYLPISFPLISDHYRNEDTDLQKKVDFKIQEMLKLYKNSFRINATTLEDRTKEAVNIIKSKT
jgi:deoxyadenosine/deoxycytidine kinase